MPGISLHFKRMLGCHAAAALEVDRIDVQIEGSDSLELGITPFIAYIKDEVLADTISFDSNTGETVEIEGEKINVSIFKK